MHLTIPRPGRAPMRAILEEAKAPRGTFLIAPGRGYHMGLPLMASAAAGLVAHGFHALRFDWEFFVEGTQPSEGLTLERQQIEGALAWLQERYVDQPQFLFGKSLGSRAALAWGQTQSARLAGMALSTLPLHPPGEALNLHVDRRDLSAIECPLWIACGDRDPLCDLDALYALTEATQPTPHVLIAPGNHCFEDAEMNNAWAQANIDQVVQGLLLWADQLLSSC